MTDIDALTAIITLRFHLVDAPTIGRLLADADNATTVPLLERMRSSGLLSAEDSDRVAAMTQETLASFRYPAFDAAGTLPSETRVGPIVELSKTGYSAQFGGRYELREEIAHGGMGRIYRAYDRKLHREVALKVQLRASTRDASFRLESTPLAAASELLQRFVREAHVTAQLEHPSIVPVHELGQDADGAVYYTMKLIRGRSLEEALTRADTLEGRLGYLQHFLNVCHAIAFAHNKGIVHRDLKPHNIMVGQYGETQLIDWGLAKVRDISEDTHSTILPVISHAAEDGVAKTLAGSVVGTPAYMAPKQATGRAHEFSPKHDVYALGAILYRLLTGFPPGPRFKPHNRDEFVAHERRAVLDAVPNAPRELVAICEKSMAFDPEERYAGASELAEDIQRYMNGQWVQAYRYRLADRIWRRINRHRSFMSAAAITVVVGLVLLTLAYYRVRQERDFAQALLNEMERSEPVSTMEVSARASNASGAVTYDIVLSSPEGDLLQLLSDDVFEMLRTALSKHLRDTGLFNPLDANSPEARTVTHRVVAQYQRGDDGIVTTLSVIDAQGNVVAGPVTHVAPNDLIQLRDAVLKRLAGELAEAPLRTTTTAE